MMRFDKIGKLSLRYEVPYKILKKVWKVANGLQLPAELAALQPVYHISLLKKYVGDPAFVVPLECMAVKFSISYEDILVEILKH